MSNGRIKNPFNPIPTGASFNPLPAGTPNPLNNPNFNNGLKPLNEQMKLFVKYYVEGNYVATEAAIKAGYAKNYGANLLQMPNVQDAVRKEVQRRNRRIEITQDRVLEELSVVAFGNLAEFFEDFGKGRSLSVKPKDDLTEDQQRQMASISESLRGGQRTLKFRAHDKLRALTLLAQYMGMLDGAGKQVDPEGMAARLREAAAKATDTLPTTIDGITGYDDQQEK